MVGQDYGHTELRLMDSNTPIDHNVSADIYVVKPHHLGKWLGPYIILEIVCNACFICICTRVVRHGNMYFV